MKYIALLYTKVLYIVLFMVSLSSCNMLLGKYDNLILLDENTGKRYELNHNIGDSYFVDELYITISGKDTTLVKLSLYDDKYNVNYDNFILTDINTDKRYILKYNKLDRYFVKELYVIISGKDTMLVSY